MRFQAVKENRPKRSAYQQLTSSDELAKILLISFTGYAKEAIQQRMTQETTIVISKRTARMIKQKSILNTRFVWEIPRVASTVQDFWYAVDEAGNVFEFYRWGGRFDNLVTFQRLRKLSAERLKAILDASDLFRD